MVRSDDLLGSLRAGIAIYDAGRYHAAHDAWEDHWLGLERGSDDERLLHGLIQCTAAVHHATNRNWEGAVGLAESAVEYLAAVPPTYRGVNVDGTRSYLQALASDPAMIERKRPWPLTYEGEIVRYDDLSPNELVIAGEAIAAAEGYDEELIERAGAFAEDNRIGALLRDFLTEDAARGVIAQRLGQHVDRLEARQSDLDGLF